MQNNIEPITHIIEPSVLNELERLGAKLKAIAKSFELTRRVIINASKIVWQPLRGGRSRLACKRNHYRNINKKPQLRKTK